MKLLVNMKEEAIKKINKIGKVSSVFALIGKSVLGMSMALLTILTLMVVVGVNSISLFQKEAQYAAKEQELLLLIEQEQARTVELEEFATYTKTKKYAEEVAKDKLGLVYENEIIFQEAN